jgi:hypothetical protein
MMQQKQQRQKNQGDPLQQNARAHQGVRALRASATRYPDHAGAQHTQHAEHHNTQKDREN